MAREKSFESWGSYARALKATPQRFCNRVKARSVDEAELQEVKARSNHDMKKTLNWWDLICFGVGAVVGAGIFVLTGQEAHRDAGPAIVLSYVVSGFSAMLSVFCYTEFAVEIPVAGGSFAYLRVELGDFVAFIAAGNILLESVIGTAAVARAFTSNLATLFNRSPSSFLIKVHSLGDDYGNLDLVAVALIALVCAVAVTSIKGSSRLNYTSTVLHVAIILFIIVVGLTKANTANYSPFIPYSPHGIFKASAIVYFSYLGFDSVATMAEETKNPGRDIPIGLVGSMSVTTVIYCLMCVTLCLMQPYTALDEAAAFPVAFDKAGLGWTKYVVSLGAVMGMVTVLVVGAVGQARYLTHIARTRMLPPWLAHVNAHTGTPVNATVVTAVAAAIVAFFTNLHVLSSLLSISTLFIFVMVAIALLVRRYYSSGHTSDSDRNKLVFFLVLIVFSSIATAVYWGLNDNQWVGYCVTVPMWMVATLGLSVMVPQAKKPRVWGVPMVPWLPSASIFINVFLLGSIDKMSFVRFGVWTVLLLVYYVFVGLHASFDIAMEKMKMTADVMPTIGKAEQGEAINAVNDVD